MSEKAMANAIAFSLVAGYVIARIAYGGPDHATWLDILVVIGAALLGASTRLLNKEARR
jgi:hypothetical protein